MVLSEFPKSERIEITFRQDETVTYIITKNDAENKYYLYLRLDNGYQYLKSKADPLFKEVYPEL